MNSIFFKSSPIQETQVQSLGQKDPLKKKMATHSSSLAWKIPWTEEPGRRAIVQGGCKEWDVTEHAHVCATEKHEDRVL